MNDLSDDMVVRIASYGEARDLLRLALACQRFGSSRLEGTVREWSLMGEAARSILQEATKGDAGAGVVLRAYTEWLQLQNRVAVKSGEQMVSGDHPLAAQQQELAEEVDETSWMKLYRELELVRMCRPLNIGLPELLGDGDLFGAILERFKDPQSTVTKLSICGPETTSRRRIQLPDAVNSRTFRVKKAFRAIATMPNLHEIVIDPGYYLEDGGELKSSRLCWLLSPQANYRTLRVANLDLQRQSDVKMLAKAFASNTSIQTLCIHPIHIGYRDVTTVAPLMEAIASLPKLKRLRLTFDAFGHGRATNRYVQESLPILRAVRGVTFKAPSYDRSNLFSVRQVYPELSNCTDIDALI